MSGLRSDSELVQTVVGRMADELAQLVFARSLRNLPPPQRLDLMQAVGEVVQITIDEYCPEEPTEPCAMSAAKDEAEG